MDMAVQQAYYIGQPVAAAVGISCADQWPCRELRTAFPV